MKTNRRLVPFSALLLLTISAFSQQPPANDNFENRIPLQGATLDFSATAYGASIEPNDPTAIEKIEQVDTASQSFVYTDKIGSTWWSWTAPITGYALFTVLPNAAATEWQRPLLVVHRGDTLANLNDSTRLGVLGIYPGFYASVPITADQPYSFAFVNDLRTNVTFAIHVQTAATPIILQQPQSQTIRAGGACHFAVLAPGCMTNKNVQWQHNGADIPGANSPTLLIHNATKSAVGEYRARVNIQNPGAGSLSDAAILTVEGEDMQPNVMISPANAGRGLTLQAMGEAGQYYTLERSTNLSNFQPHQPGQYFAHSWSLYVSSSEQNVFFRAVRAGNMAQRCIANQRRIDFAKNAWRIDALQVDGAAVPIVGIDRFLDGVTIQCPLGGELYYSAVGTPAGCTFPGHQ